MTIVTIIVHVMADVLMGVHVQFMIVQVTLRLSQRLRPQLKLLLKLRLLLEPRLPLKLQLLLRLRLWRLLRLQLGCNSGPVFVGFELVRSFFTMTPLLKHL